MARSTALAVPRTYAALRRAVENVIIKGQRAAELAKVRTYHETGRLIREHLLAHKDRADYGAKLIQRLASDLNIDRSVLQRCDQFYRAFPICAGRHKLTWAHYRVLVPVPDAARRRSLADEADAQEWTAEQLERRVHALFPPRQAEAATLEISPAAARLLAPRRGTPGVCRVVADGDGVAVDLGFASYLSLPIESGKARASSLTYEVGDFVRVEADGIRTAMDATKADLFTYHAEVIKVVDGDTLWVKIFLRPGHWVKEKLRLRDIDCPEIATTEGKAAQRFTAALVARATAVTVCTTKPDKYDRYLADVFLAHPGGETYLNNALLGNGHATVKREWEFGDWGDR